MDAICQVQEDTHHYLDLMYQLTEQGKHMKKNLPITNVEKSFSSDANILSTTDLKGAITYINKDFVDISGFEEDELIGMNHNMVRHPEMPPAAFEDLWSNLKAGNSWMGMVKNRCKNGDHYWVDAYATPIRENGQTVEYQSVRSKPAPEHVARADKVYKQLNEGKVPAGFKDSKLSLPLKLILGVTASTLVATLISATVTGMELSSVIVTLLLAVGLSAAVLFILLRPLSTVVAKAKSVAGNPISRYVYTGRNDEVGSLLLAIKMLESEAGGIVGRISDSSRQLSANAEELTATVEMTTQGVQQQYSETDQVATAVNEMTASIQEVAGNAQQAANAANQGRDEASNGTSVVSGTMRTIEGLAKEVVKAADVIKEVEADSNNISTILDVIRGISEQTNLLALNAAIEAARAGEQGRGFAVVADEVRTLATRTKDATQEIQKMIEKLQHGSREAVSVMEHSSQQATQSVEQAGEAVASLNNISDVIDTVNDMSTQIAAAVEQQSAVAEEINRSIITIRDVSENTMEGARMSEEATRNMSNMAQGLQVLAAEFWSKRTGS